MKYLFFFLHSRRNSNVKQWSVAKKRFNDSPKEVNTIIISAFFFLYSFLSGYSLAY
jgi:hypothetical protein